MTHVRGDLLPAAARVELRKKRRPWNVWATGYPPAGQRRHWLLVTDNCPYCISGSHAHRGGPDGGIRRAGCGGGAYVVLVRSVEPEVVE